MHLIMLYIKTLEKNGKSPKFEDINLISMLRHLFDVETD